MASIKIAKSVGKNGKNGVEDTKKIQTLLNTHKSQGGYSALAVDGDVGKKTIAAIVAFQSKVMGVKADGRVDAEGRTLAALNAKPGTVTPAPGGSADSGEKPIKKPSGISGKKAEVEKRIAAAKEAIAETSSAIRQQETVSVNLRKREQFIEALRQIMPKRIEQAKAAIEAADDARHKSALNNLHDAFNEASLCADKTENDAHQILESAGSLTVVLTCGIKIDPGLGKKIRDNVRILTDDKLAKVSAKLDEAAAITGPILLLILGAIKAARIGNEAYILALKAKLALHEKALEMAEKELKGAA